MKFLLAALTAGALAIPHHTELSQDTYSFEDYEKDFNKNYEADEREMRRAIFNKNLADIVRINKSNTSWHASVSPISDLSDEEYQRMLGRRSEMTKGMNFASNSDDLDVNDIVPLSDLPKNVDWRKEGIITPVKDQGACGSCWAFAATQQIESYYALSSGALVDLAVQQLVDCVENTRKCGGSGGCSGAVEVMGYQHVIDIGGMETQWRYWYHSGVSRSESECKVKPANRDINNRVIADGTKPVTIASYKVLPRNNYEAVMRHLAFKGPLAVGIDAGLWKNYKGGVFKGCPRSGQRVDQNHAVQLVGYGEDVSEGPYWIVRNSWGPFWGERGYIRIKRDVPGDSGFCLWDVTPQHGSACEDELDPVKMCGSCGILYEPTYVETLANSAQPVNPSDQDKHDGDNKLFRM